MVLTHSHDRAEDFLTHRDRLGILRMDDSWLDKVPSRIVSVAAKQDLPALLLRRGNIASDLLECRLATIEDNQLL